MTESSTQFDIQTFLAYRLNILAKRMSTAISDIYMTEFDISIPEWRTLLWTNSNDKVYAKDISFHCLMDKTHVSRVITKLEERGLLMRQVDENDQRSQRLFLTDEGKSLVEQIIPKATEWEDNMASVLTKRQYQQLFTTIDRLEQRIVKMTEESE